MSNVFRSFKNGADTSSHRRPMLSKAGTILVVSGDRTVYPDFAATLTTVQTPAGSGLLWQKAGGGALATARNDLAVQALEAGAAWVWFIDDDHVFKPDIVGRLLRHDRDIVVPFVMTRRPPFRPVMWPMFEVGAAASDDDLMQAWRDVGNDPPKIPDGGGLVEIGHGGTGGMLISARVLRALPQPWFEWRQFNGQSCGEDTWFCLKARRAGFRIWCDLDTPMGHLTTAAVWPEIRDGVARPRFEFDLESVALD
jgi:hypothetical protein